MKPLGNFVILKPVEEKNDKGIIITLDKEKKEAPERGEVIAKGPECSQAFEVGDTVIFRKYTPDIFEKEGEIHLVLVETDIMAIIE